MKLQIGRVGLDVDDQHIAVGAQWGPDKITLDVLITANDVDELDSLRQQVIGLGNNPDEPIVPVIVDPDDGMTGFWRVADVSVDMTFDPWGNLAFPATFQLERIVSSPSPRVQSSLAQSLRTNSAGIDASTVLFWHATPAGAESYSLPLAPTSRPSESGDVSLYAGDGVGPDSALENGWASWVEEPADHYMGAAMIEIGAVDDPTDGGTTTPSPPVGAYFPVIGRTMRNYRYGWRLNNGLIRIKPIYSADTVGFVVEAWTGSRWSLPTLFQLTSLNSFTGMLNHYPQSIRSVTVKHNAPEYVELLIGTSDDQRRRGTIAISLRRGSLYLECYRTETQLSNVNDKLTVARLPIGASGTLTTSGVAASAADTDGMKWLLVQADPGLGDPTNGLIRRTSGLTHDFAIGLTSTVATPLEVAREYMAAGGETVRIVGQ